MYNDYIQWRWCQLKWYCINIKSKIRGTSTQKIWCNKILIISCAYIHIDNKLSISYWLSSWHHLIKFGIVSVICTLSDRHHYLHELITMIALYYWILVLTICGNLCYYLFHVNGQLTYCNSFADKYCSYNYYLMWFFNINITMIFSFKMLSNECQMLFYYLLYISNIVHFIWLPLIFSIYFREKYINLMFT